MAQGKKTIINAKLCPPALNTTPQTAKNTLSKSPHVIDRQGIRTLHLGRCARYAIQQFIRRPVRRTTFLPMLARAKYER